MDHVQTTGLVLLVGALSFMVGAGLQPDPTKLWTVGLREHLAMVHRGRRRWHLMNVLIVASMVITSSGLFMLVTLTAPSLRLLAAAVTWLIGAIAWIAALTFRDTVVSDVAASVESTGEIPGWLEPLQHWTGQLFWVHMSLSYAALALIGWTMVDSGLFSVAVGWFTLIYAAALGLLFVLGKPKLFWGPIAEPPFLVHIPVIVLGITLLTR